MADSEETIALCLSGGGLRATLFHLGVLRALRAYTLNGEMALKKVREVYAVSGGSILAAHFLKNYERYIGADADFDAARAEVLALARRDIRNRVLRRWGLSWAFGGSRGFWLQREYVGLIGDTKLSACYRKRSEGVGEMLPPRVHFLATNFNTGELCSFSGTNFEKIRRTKNGVETDSTAAGSIKLAFAVAASSSFPPMFPPIRLKPEMLGRPDNPEFASPIELSDGGVYDNFGIDKFRMTGRDGPAPEVLIVSNAGGSFDTAAGKRYGSMLSRNIRASDIMMRRVGDSTLEAGAEAGGKGYTLVRIGATVDDGTLEVPIQHLLRLVRTDLDCFSPDLAALLVDHGCRVAFQAFAERGWACASKPEIPYDDSRDAALAETASKAAQRSVLPLFVDFRDFVWLAIWWLLMLTLIAGAAFGGWSYYQARTARAAAVAAREVAINTIEKQLDQVRLAALDGDLVRIRNVLAIVITTTQDLGNTAAAEVATVAPTIDQAQVQTIIAGAPALPAVRETRYQQAVYIQFAGVLTRAQITALNQSLRSAGWHAQGGSGERTPSAAGLNEVRYSGSNGEAARQLAAALDASGLLSKPVVAKENSRIGASTLEVWISR